MPTSTYHDTTERQYPFPRLKVQHLLNLYFPVEEAPTRPCQSRGDLNYLICLFYNSPSSYFTALVPSTDAHCHNPLLKYRGDGEILTS